jgi:hypothetical protein
MLRSTETASRNCGRGARGDVGALAEVRADGEEGRVEVAHRLLEVGDLAVELELDAEVEDALDLRVEDLAREPVARDAEAHHAAGARAGIADRHRVAAAREMVGRRQAGRPGTDDQHALARRRGRHIDGPALLDRLVTEEALDRVDPDRLVEVPAVAGRSRTGGSRPGP